MASQVESFYFTKGFDNFLNVYNKHKHLRFIVTCPNQNIASKIMPYFKDKQIDVNFIDYFEDGITGKINITNLQNRSMMKLGNSVLVPFSNIMYGLDNFETPNNQKIQKLLEELQNFEIGDLVIHKKHGMSIFKGLKQLNSETFSGECFELIFKKDTKMLLPIQEIIQIKKHSRAGTFSEDEAELDSIGGATWLVKRQKIKTRILAFAQKIIDVAAKRKLKEAKRFDHGFESETYQTFERNFEFIETEDQLNAIMKLKEDLSLGTPMNRIICGDTGFGKTEVAMRAVCAIVAEGSQALMVSPTTFLAKQHFQSFKDRFKDLNVSIELLHGKTTAKKRKEILEQLSNGKIQILISTHAGLTGKIDFKDIQLCIIDEEQMFGVKQKDTIKEKYPSVHILYLSATPIPRSLQQGLYGLCELSLLNTPPFERKKPHACVINKDKTEIFNAIKKELNRNGNILVIVPKIENIPETYRLLQGYSDDIKIDTVHGKVEPSMAEDIILRFAEKQSDILISTTITAFGMDFKYANTVLVFNPEMFGVGQLYQIKGRAGRRDKAGFCYFILDERAAQKENTVKRIEFVANANDFGSGFAIASFDSDMRGGGNLLGSEQSGDVKEVGFEMYQEMLEEAMNSVDHLDEKIEIESTLNGITHYISDHYIPSVKLKINFYRKIANITTKQELDNIKNELENRFGDVPVETQNLFILPELKILLKNLNVSKINVFQDSVKLKFYKFDRLNVQKILTYPQDVLSVIGEDSLRISIKKDFILEVEKVVGEIGG